MKDQWKCTVHFEDKGVFLKVHWRILEDSGRVLARLPRDLGLNFSKNKDIEQIENPLFELKTKELIAQLVEPWGQFHRAILENFPKHVFSLSILKQTTSQNTYILCRSLAGNQENLLSKYFL